jgi:hypothetical protein
VDGFEVPTELVAEAGGATGRVADVVGGLDFATPMRGLGSALPASRTATTAGQAGGAWVAGVTALGEQLRRQSDALIASARAYAETDATAMAVPPAAAPPAPG